MRTAACTTRSAVPAEDILIAEVDLVEVTAGRRLSDPAGHYNRPDVFRLSVDTRPQRALSIMVEDPRDLAD